MLEQERSGLAHTFMAVPIMNQRRLGCSTQSTIPHQLTDYIISLLEPIVSSFVEYFSTLPEDRKEVMEKLRHTIRTNLPDGFEEAMNYGMPSWVVPHSTYPDGYHVDPKLPLSFLSIASQKRHIGFYHMGIYASAELLEWFTGEYPNHCKTKLDMGKSCIRFKNPANIPHELIKELCSKMSVQEWIDLYEEQYR